MAELTLRYHPIGTRAFVADLASVREVDVTDVILLMSSDRGASRHVVIPADGGDDLTFDQYTFPRIHLARADAEAELAVNAESRKRLAESRA